MSTVIENQIVQMSFDNKEFEKNISASMKSLDQFKDEMEFKDSERSFKNLEKASESIDFDKLNKAIDGVGDHFSLVGRVFYKVTDEIANYFTSKITGAINAVKSVTTDIIDPKAGYSKYDQYTHGVKTILSALSEEELARLEANGESAIDGVEAKLEELMAYTDETSYNFVDMVSTIGKFLGAGINLDSAIADMQGIANWAALAGQNSTIASQAMYQMSQALGAGYVKYMDWTQMANLKNMGTTAAKDTFIQAAMNVGTITDEDINQAKKVLKDRGQEITDAAIRNWFFEADQLNNEKARWFTTDVLEGGLHMFSKVSDEVIGMTNNLSDASSLSVTQFLRAAKAVKKGEITVTDAMKELSGQGLIASEDMDRVRKSMENVTSAEYELGFKAFLAAQEAVTFQEAVEATKDAVSTGWMQVFRNLIGNYEEAATLWTDLANNMWEVFAGPLANLNGVLSKWRDTESEYFTKSGKQLTKREALWMSLSKAVGGIVNIFSALLQTLSGWTGTLEENVLSLLDRATNGLYNIGEVLNGIADSKTLTAMGEIIGKLYSIFGKLIGAAFRVAKAFFGIDSSASDVDDGLSTMLYGVYAVIDAIASCIDAILGSKGFAFALKLISEVMGQVYMVMSIAGNAIQVVGQLFRKAIQTLVHSVTDTSDIEESFSSLGVSIAAFIGHILHLMGISPNIAIKIVGPIMRAFDALGEIFGSLFQSIGDLKEQAISTMNDAPNAFVGGMKVIGLTIVAVASQLGELVSKIFNFKGSKIVEKLKSIASVVFNAVLGFFNSAGDKLSQAFSAICFDIFELLPKRFSEMMERFKVGTGPQKVDEVLSFIGDCLNHGVNRIIEAVDSVTGINLAGFKEKVVNFFEDLIEKMGGVTPTFAEAWDKIVDIFWILVDVFNEIANAVFEIIGKVTGIEDFGPDKIFDLIFWILSNLVGLLVWIATAVGDVIVSAGPYIIAIAELIRDGFSQIWLAFKYLIGFDESDEAMKAMENIKKVLVTAVKVLIVIEVLSFFRRLKWLMGTISDLGENFTGYRPDTVMASLSMVIRAIGIVLLALAILSRQDIGKLAMALIAMDVAVVMINTVFKDIVSELKDLVKWAKKNEIDGAELNGYIKNINKIFKIISRLIIQIALVLTLLTWANDKFGADAMTSATMSLAISIMVISVGAKAIIKASSDLSSSADQLKGVKKVINKLLTAITLIASTLFIAMKVLKYMESKGLSGKEAIAVVVGFAAVFVVFTIGVKTILKASKNLNDSQATGAAKTVAKTGSAVGFMAIVVGGLGYLLSNYADEYLIESIALGLGIMLACTIIMAGVIILISKFAGPKIVSQASSALSNLAKAAGQVAVIAAVIDLIVVASISVLAVMFILYKVIETAKPLELIGAMASTFLLFLAVGLLVKMMATIHIESAATQILAFSVAMVAMAIAVRIFVSSVQSLQDSLIELEDIKAIFILGVVAVALTVFAGVASLLTPGITSLLSFAGAMLAMSLALLVFCGVMGLISDGIEIDTLLQIAGAFAVFVGVFAILAGIISIVPGVTKAITALGNAIFKMALGLAILVAVIMAMTIIDKIADQLNGAMIGLQEKIPELIESVVTLLVVILNALADSLMEHAEEIGTALYKLLLAIVGIVFTLLSAIFEDTLKPVLEAVGDWFSNVWDGIVEGFWSVVNFFKKIGEAIIDFFVGLWDDICDFFGIASPSKKFMDFGLNLLLGLWEGIKGAAEWIWDLIVGLFTGLWNGIVGVFKSIFDFGKSLLQKIWDGISAGFNAVSSFIKNVFTKIWDFITAPFKAVFELGKNIVKGLWDGINNMVKWVCDKITGFCGKALGAIKKFFGIHSPSTVMAGIGNFMMEGLGIGLDQGEGGVLEKVTSIASNVLGGFSGMTDIPVGFDTSSIPGMSDLSVDNFTVDGMVDYSNMMAFDPGSAGLSSVYSMDIMPNYNAMGGMDIPTNFQPTIKDSQLEQITDAEMTGTQDIVDAINSMKEEISKQAEIISKYQMILDTGVLVGELTAPIDKALGNRSRLATGRGI